MERGRTLLEIFFGGAEHGIIMYKSYPPSRGDDVPALLHLASAAKLPRSLRFVALQPDIPSLIDFRSILPRLLRAHGLPAGHKDAIRTPWRREDRQRAGELLTDYLQIVLSRMDCREPVERVMNDLRDQFPKDAFDLLLQMIHLNTSQRDAQRSAGTEDGYSIPSAPLLIVGRPELFRDYANERSALRQILKSVGYPNRYLFSGRQRDRDLLLDRKTGLVYKRKENWRNDLGFIYIRQKPDGYPVVVVEGASSLGTLAGVKLLTDPRPVFTRWIGDHCDACSPIDIGYHCWSTTATPPAVDTDDGLHIDLVNPEDWQSFKWEQWEDAEGERASLLSGLSSIWRGKQGAAAKQTHGDGYMSWEWQRPETIGAGSGGARGTGGRKLVRVGISAPAYVVSSLDRNHPQIMLAGRPTAELLDLIIQHLKDDLTAWGDLIRTVVGRGKLPEDLIDLAQSISPILLLGDTGTGKQLVAQFIARAWQGQELVPSGPVFSSAHAYPRLRELMTQWPSRPANVTVSTMHSYNVNAVSPTLLDSELFGVERNAATQVDAKTGVFLLAGTGVLFLDELLELDIAQQAKLLNALERRRIRPTGAMQDYPYLCRVVAATNKAKSEADFPRLQQEGRLRGDIIGRFKRRYTLLPLPQRPQEIILILMAIIRWIKHWDTYPFMRISRVAFEALHSYSFPYNIRDLESLARSLPDRLINDMAHPYRGSTNGDRLPACSVCLRDLDAMRRVNRTAASRTMLVGETEPEDEFYEFSVQETMRHDVSSLTMALAERQAGPQHNTPAENTAGAMPPIEPPSSVKTPPARPKAAPDCSAFRGQFQAFLARNEEALQPLRDNAEAWLRQDPEQDKLPDFLKQACATAHLREAVRLLIVFLKDCSSDHGLVVKRESLSEIFRRPDMQHVAKQAPYAGLCPTATLPAATFSLIQKVALRAANKDPSGGKSDRRLPRGIQIDVIVSLLFGKPMYRS